MSTRIAAALLFTVCAFAHEIGTTRVAVSFDHHRTFDITVVTDASSLSEKIRMVGGTAAFDQTFRKRVRVTFDGQEVQPSIQHTVSAQTDTIRLTGDIPTGASHFQWTYGWTFASYGLTVRESSSAEPVTEWLEGNQTSKPFALAAPEPLISGWRTAWMYLGLGFTHILPNGLDHMLFVLGLYLLSGRARTVLTQVSAFTIAHSITLGLSMYGLVNAPSRIVEPMIALSIAYVAIENIFLSELKPWRVALVFAFGLLHGMGFAGALKELGLPRSEFLTALLTFNIGVEAGQLTVIAAAFMLVGWHYSGRTWYRSRVVVPMSAVIACTAVYWTITRLS